MADRAASLEIRQALGVRRFLSRFVHFVEDRRFGFHSQAFLALGWFQSSTLGAGSLLSVPQDDSQRSRAANICAMKRPIGAE